MKYVCYRRFKDRAICGDVNIPATSECELVGNTIYYNGNPICLVKSENAHQYFACDYDGKGMERGGLTRKIQDTLSRRDRDYQARWDNVWEAAFCHKYRRQDYDDFWIWNHDFFNAEVEDLERIYNLVKGGN